MKMQVASVFFVALHICMCFAAKISKEEFNQICAENGNPNVDPSIYDDCIATQCEKYSKEEIAMIITQFLHESGTFQFKKEWACSQPGNENCPGSYKDQYGKEGKYYYGRGFIQLTWGKNYKDAGEALGVDLLEHPELVEETPMACATSLWYWDHHVHQRLQESNFQKFGISTDAINGGLECRPESTPEAKQRAQHRYEIYQKVCKAMNVTPASETGCYN